VLVEQEVHFLMNFEVNCICMISEHNDATNNFNAENGRHLMCQTSMHDNVFEAKRVQDIRILPTRFIRSISTTISTTFDTH
jgi:hypothetical protein